MKLSRKPAIAGLLLAGALALFGPPKAAQAIPPALHVVGNQLKDVNGNPVVLRGVNIPGMEFLYTGDHMDTSPGVAVNTWKSNVIRFPLNEDFWFGYNGTGTPAADGGASYRTILDNAINTITAAGAYVLLDGHWGDKGVWGANNGQQSGPDDHSTLFWQDVANRYKNNPAILFDLWNEPNSVSWSVWRDGGTISENGINYHSPGHQGLLNTIRGTGATNVVLAEALAWATDASGIVGGYALSDSANNTMYQIHMYPSSGSDATGWDSHAGAVGAVYPILIGEWGTANGDGGVIGIPQPDAPTWTQNYLSWLDLHQYNWTAWSFHRDTTPVLLADWSYTPTSYFGQYVLNYLTTHTSPGTTFRSINSGGLAQGSFVPDANYNGGTSATYTATINTTGVTNPAPAAVYQSERWGNFSYTMPGFNPSTTATVRLHFCENNWTAAGQRKFNVSINGTQVLTNFDVFATAGAAHKAVIQQFTTNSDANGKIAITFTGVVDNAQVCGIEIQATPSAPAGLIATPGDTKVVLTWSAGNAATSTNLYRGTSPGGEGATAIVTGITGTTYTDTGLANGTTYYYTVKAVNAFGTGNASNEAVAQPSSTFKIDVAGPAASPFVADMNFSGGNTATNWTGAIDTSAVTNPAPQAVYQTERWGNFSYTFQGMQINAAYTIRLHFCENYDNAAGLRKFNVTINNTQVLTNFDIFAATGAQHKANVQQFSTTSDGTGTITVTFTTVADNALLDGIEVFPTAVTIPPVPTGVIATAGDAQVSLVWNTSSGATGYNVLRSTVSGSGYASVASGIAVTNYTNTGLTNGTTYYYVVQAANTAGTSGNSAQASATPTAGAAPSPIIRVGFNENTGASAANAGTAGGSLTLTSGTPTWSTNVPAAVGGASSVDFGTTSGNFGVDSAAAISALGGLTKFTITGWVNCKSSTIGAGGNRIVTWINNGGNGVDLVYLSDGSLQMGINQWPDTSAAHSSAAKITTDAAASAGNWRFFAITYDSTLGTNNTQFYFGSNTVTAVLDVTNTYAAGAVGTAIGPLTIGHFNTLTRAGATDRMFRGIIDDVRVYGTTLTASQIATVQGSGGSAPPAPTGLTATAGNTQVALSWTASSGATSYNVLRSTVSGSGYASIATGIAATTYTNTGLSNGTTYYFVVTATNGTGTSGNSNQASATPQAAIPPVPSGLTATAGNAQVALSWSASSGATAYDVKRSTVSGSGYVTASSPTTTSYTNTGLTNGTTYYFVVAAKNASGSSANSAQVSATPNAAAFTFYRAINLNGSALTIDGNAWEASTAANFAFTGNVFANQTVTLSPATDANRATMIRSSVWGAGATLTMSGVPNDTYQVYLYTWEDNAPTTFSVTLEGTTVLSNFNSGAAGAWTKHGPWTVAITDGAINVVTSGGDANLSGLEVWRAASALPTPIIKVNLNENTGTTTANTGSAGGSLTRTTPTPAWSTNVPATIGGASSVDFGTTVGNFGVDSAAAISALSGLAKFTITGWVNCKSSTIGAGGNRIVTWINNGANGVDLVYQSDGSLQLGVNTWPDNSPARSSAAKIPTDAAASAGNWRFFAVTYDSTLAANHAQFYFGSNTVDATLDVAKTYGQGAVGATVGPLTIGHFNTLTRAGATDRMFRGLIDNVQVFGTVLTSAQIVSAQRSN